MLNWFFKKSGPFGPLPAPTPTTKPARTTAPAQPPAADAAPKPPKPPKPAKGPAPPAVDGWALLQAAQGDDTALLAVAQQPGIALDVKLAAVQTLAGEASLKQAERTFRSHDRKVHRLAKQRLEAAVEQRQARATAQDLLTQTQALLEEPQLAINQLVELDKAWNALPAHALEATQVSAFADLRERLSQQMLARTDAEQRFKRWSADTRQSLATWPAQLLAAAESADTDLAAALGQSLRALIDTQPPGERAAESAHALEQASAHAQAVLAHLQLLQSVPEAGSEPPAAPTAEMTLAPALAAALHQRHQQWLQQHWPAPAKAEPPLPAAAAARPAKPARAQPLGAEQQQALTDLLQAAETALAEGQLSGMQRQLQAIESLLAKARATLPESLRARHQALWAEQDRLKEWQQWGGARARDDLAAEAEVLARLTLPVEVAAAPPADAPPTEPGAEPPVAAPILLPPPKLDLKAHNDSIRSLRQRWKDLDRQRAAATQAQWQRFDAALTVAYAPVAAQLAALKQARELNLAEREALLTALEALPMASDEVGATPDWKMLSRELDRFQTAWRKLGPLEHTAPHAAQGPLQQRLQAALAHVEAPLQAARAAAIAHREQLITRVEQLRGSGPEGGIAPAATRQVRELQGQWQDHARQLPLPRGAETALWARFKAATDAVFTQLDARHAARDADLATNLAHAESLIARLQALSATTPLKELESTLAEVDREWRQGGELPRGAGQALEPRYREARDAAWALAGQIEQQRWRGQCDTLAAKLQLCQEIEAAGPGTAPDPTQQARWAELPALPAAWEQALAQRWARKAPAAGLPPQAFDDLLLRLEMALGMPATPTSQAARQALKLRLLKETLEGRGATTEGPSQHAGWWLTALKQGGLNAEQQQRLQALLAALVQAPPGSLLSR